jgi:hypothetical protein
MTAGRPTKYNKGVLQKAEAYINHYDDHGDAVPTAAGLACVLRVGKRTLYSWAERHAEFQHTLDKLNATQERVLTSHGLTGNFSSVITKLMLCNHGYSDKKETQLAGGDGKSLFSDFAAAVKGNLEKRGSE